MKIYTFSISLLFLTLMAYGVINMNTPQGLEGTWVMKNGVTLYDNIQVDLTEQSHTKHMKVINKSHFTTVWQDRRTKENDGFNGGTYTFENGIYTEYLKYFNHTSYIGDTARYKIEFNENTFSMSSCDKNGEISETGYFQVWERIE